MSRTILRVPGKRAATSFEGGSRIKCGLTIRARALSSSLDLGFLELDVLAGDRVVLLEAQLLGLGARVLLRHVEEAGIGAADELDLDGCRLGHLTVPNA